MTDLDNVEHIGGRTTSSTILDRPEGRPGDGRVLPVATPGREWTNSALPRMGVLRDMTDRAVFDQVLTRGRVTRAELSTATGISKPTISDAVRRMGERGIMVETGYQTGRRGRVATYYELAPDSGWVLAVELDADGMSVSAAGLNGTVLGESYRPMPADDSQLSDVVSAMLQRERESARDRGPLRVLALSVVNQVDPAHGDVISMANWSLPQRVLSVRSVLGDLGDTQLLIDNDVNFAAHAERETGVAQEASSFGYLYIGGTLGFAYHLGDRLVRGAHGMAGEIGLLPVGLGRDVTVLQALVRLGFGRPDGTALDPHHIRDVLDQARAGDEAADDRAEAICNVLVMAIAGIQAVCDPELMVMGGPLGRDPMLLDRLTSGVTDRYPFAAPIVGSSVDAPVALRGAMLTALAAGREQLMRTAA